MEKRFVFNNKGMKEARVLLRHKQTEAEKCLWNKLRRNLTGFKWYRQYSVGKFVLDFYCPKRKLAVELDGGIHFTKDRPVYDQNRSVYLREHGIEVRRFRNEEVLKLGKTMPLP
jgi:very-short-patch-repair endonuclease